MSWFLQTVCQMNRRWPILKKGTQNGLTSLFCLLSSAYWMATNSAILGKMTVTSCEKTDLPHPNWEFHQFLIRQSVESTRGLSVFLQNAWWIFGPIRHIGQYTPKLSCIHRNQIEKKIKLRKMCGIYAGDTNTASWFLPVPAIYLTHIKSSQSKISNIS